MHTKADRNLGITNFRSLARINRYTSVSFGFVFASASSVPHVSVQHAHVIDLVASVMCAVKLRMLNAISNSKLHTMTVKASTC